MFVNVPELSELLMEDGMLPDVDVDDQDEGD